jgi:hypothetical protein
LASWLYHGNTWVGGWAAFKKDDSFPIYKKSSNDLGNGYHKALLIKKVGVHGKSQFKDKVLMVRKTTIRAKPTWWVPKERSLLCHSHKVCPKALSMAQAFPKRFLDGAKVAKDVA